MTRKDDEDFENSSKCWICDITGNCRGSVHRYCNIKVKLNHKIPIVFHNLKNYDTHLIAFNFQVPY